MNLEKLVEKYFAAIKTGEASRLILGQRAAIRSFIDWADRRGYQVIQTKGENGAAIFCAKCGGYLGSFSQTENKPEGG